MSLVRQNPIQAKHRLMASHLPALEPQQLQRLWTVKMPFGKYEGSPIAKLPGNYLNWFAREGFPKGELGRLLALMHEIDHNGLSELLQPLQRMGPRVD